jgi:hypothetical protein
MHPVTFRCPGCGIALSSATAFEPGKLVDCPKCKLLFTPGEDDLKIPRGRADELAMERQWAEGEIRGPYPSPSPWGWKRRYHDLGPIVQAVLIVGGGVLLVGGVALGMFLSMGRSPVPIARSVPQPPPVDPSAPSAPTTAVEPATPPVKSEIQPSSTNSSASGQSLVGDWIGTGDSAEWAGIGPVAALTFQADGKAVVRAGSALEVTSFTGTWKQTSRDGDRTRVRLDLGGVLELTVQFTDNDTMRVTVKDVSGTFRRP